MNHANMTGSAGALEVVVHPQSLLSYKERGHFSQKCYCAFLPTQGPSQTGEVVSELAHTLLYRHCGNVAGISATGTNGVHQKI